MRLYRVIQPVTDIDRAATFYSRLAGAPGERVSPGRHYFDCGETILACYDPDADGDGKRDGWRHHCNQYFYFAVDDLEDVLTRVREGGGQITQDIEVMPWGERIAYALDPFGNPIAFVDAQTVFTGFAGGEEGSA